MGQNHNMFSWRANHEYLCNNYESKIYNLGEENRNLWEENENFKHNIVAGMQMDLQDKEGEILKLKELNLECLEILKNKVKEGETSKINEEVWKNKYANLRWEESKRKSNDVLEMEIKLKEMQEQFNVKMEDKEKGFQEKFCIWKEKEANLSQQINELSSENNKFRTIISKDKEEKESLMLSNGCLKTQVKNLEQICMDIKVQSKAIIDELQSNSSELNKRWQLEVESLNKQLLKNSCERETFVKSNDAFKNQNIMLTKTLEKYVQSNDENINEVMNLKTMLNNARACFKTIQLKNHELKQQCKLQNFILFWVMVKRNCQQPYENEKEKLDENIITPIEPILNEEKNNNENILEFRQSLHVKENFQYIENNQQITISNIEMENKNCEMEVIEKAILMVINKKMTLNLKCKIGRRLHRKNERCEIHYTFPNSSIITINKNIKRNNYHLKFNNNENNGGEGFVILKLWLNYINNNYTTTIQTKRKQKIEKFSEELHNIVVVMNDFIFNINQDIKFYNKVCNWNFEMNPCIWNPGI
ncbi:MAG TPA: hypothetical protein VEQ18_01565 [Candidatus Nitrosocosmicus sp.]|nr:hypothetical protein [Candidatus Nitrosocosmicus sp.]